MKTSARARAALALLGTLLLAIWDVRASAQGEGGSNALRWQVNSFNTANSALPNNAVAALSVTPDGTLWIGTREGLARLALGQLAEAEGGLPDRAIRCMVAAKHDAAIWVGTAHGLAQVAQGKVTQLLTQEHGLPSNAITSLAVDEHTLWVGTDRGLAAVAQGKVSQVLTESQGLPGNAIRALAAVHDGLWVGTDRGLAHVRDGQVVLVLTAEEGLPANAIHALAEDEDGGLWVGTELGIARIAQGRVTQLLTSAQGLPGNAVVALAAGAHGVLWVATPAGLARVTQGQVTHVLTTAQGLPGNAGSALSVEADGTVWFGTEKGLARVGQGQVLSVMTQQHGLPSKDIATLAMTPDGTLWVGTEKGLAAVTRGRVAQLLTRMQGLPADSIEALAADGDGVLWVGTESGLAGVAKGRVTQLLTTAQGLPGNAIRVLVQDDDGVVWVGTSAGVARLAQGRVTQTLTTHQGLPAAAIKALVAGRDGVLWVGTSAGVARVVRGQVTQVLSKEYGVALSPFSLLLAHDGVLFMGTGYGLARAAHGEVTPALTQGRWLLGAVGALVPADQGGLWAGTLYGGLARVAEGQISELLTTGHGLPSSFVRALVAGGDGVLWAGTDAGLVSLRTSGKPPQIVQLRGQQGAKLSQPRQGFTVSAFDPEFQTSAAEWRYVWQLMRPGGESKRTESRDASYEASFARNGRYTLSVQAISSSGLQSEPHVYRFDFTLAAPDTSLRWMVVAGAASAVLISLYLSLLIVLLNLYPQAAWARNALSSGAFARLPLLPAVMVHSRWARRQLFQNYAQAMTEVAVPEPYSQQAAVLEGGSTARSLVLDGSRVALDRWFQASRHTLSLGRSGSGKSVLLRFMARAAARSFLRGEPAPIPVLLDLRGHALGTQRIESLLVDAIRGAGVEMPDGLLEHVLRRGGFLLLIDSLDELPDPSAAATLHPFLNRNAHNLILIASQLDLLRRHDLTKYRMAEVTEARAQRYLQAVLGGDLWEQLPLETRSFAGNPHDLALLAQLYAVMGEGPPPLRRAELYRERLRQDAVLSPWVEQNDVEIHAVYTLAFRMLQGRQVLPDYMLRQWLREALQSHATPLATAPKHAIDELMRALTQSRMFQEESHRDANGKRQTAVWFEHELFGKFLGSRHVRAALAGPDLDARAAMIELAGLEAWSEVFYFAIDEIAARVELQTLLQGLLESAGDVRLRIVAYALGTQEMLISDPIRQQYLFAKLRADLRETPARPQAESAT